MTPALLFYVIAGTATGAGLVRLTVHVLTRRDVRVPRTPRSAVRLPGGVPESVPGHWVALEIRHCPDCGYSTPHEIAGDESVTCAAQGHTGHLEESELHHDD